MACFNNATISLASEFKDRNPYFTFVVDSCMADITAYCLISLLLLVRLLVLNVPTQ